MKPESREIVELFYEICDMWNEAKADCEKSVSGGLAAEFGSETAKSIIASL